MTADEIITKAKAQWVHGESVYRIRLSELSDSALLGLFVRSWHTSHTTIGSRLFSDLGWMVEVTNVDKAHEKNIEEGNEP